MSLNLDERLDGRQLTVAVRGPLERASCGLFLRGLREILRRHKDIGSLVLDLGPLVSLDSAGGGALAEAMRLAQARELRFRATGATGDVRDTLARITLPAPSESTTSAGPGFFERSGSRLYALSAAFRELLMLVSDTLYWGLFAPLRGRFPPPGASTAQAVQMGVNALPIVGLISFLLGLITAFQAAYQLRQFGANIFVANLVGVSMVRELGPLITAIIVAGRSGSAIAAELGTMTVGEEIDALRTMAIEPVRFLVIPRVYAITFSQPALTLYANTLGILGGFLIAVFYLDLSPTAYLDQTASALTLGDLLTGLAKSLCFAWVIVLTSCYCGLRISGGAAGVGRATTASVVASIFAIIVVDSIFTTLSTVL